ncbi:hypothetical protein Tco_1481946 [Tanacetum coccineum]
MGSLWMRMSMRLLIFLPFGVSDHSPAVLVFPEVKSRKNRAFRFLNYLTEKKEFITMVRDNWNVNVKGYAMFILAKRLKFLKKHMRDLNKKNGDVCEKFKSLKIELDRIQEALSNDPSSVHLREDELVFAKAYRRAVSDEELLSFQEVFGKCDVVYPIEDHENLFTKKLDTETAAELIKSVSDDEIKKALFDIEDNKASGPDGYTSKFFKCAWNVVGEDTCSAIKEFFSSGKLLGIWLFQGEKGIETKGPYFPLSLCIGHGDDLLLLCHGDLVSASVLRRVLDEFCLSSGLLRGMSKSEAFFGNVSESVKANICLVIPFKEGVLPIKYLGVPMVSKRITDRDCKFVIEIIRKRVADWRNKSLSFDGGLQLISSILNSLHVYWSSLFMLPIHTCNQIDRLLKNFL